MFAIANILNTMNFYVSWYQGDPQYALHDSTCSMLISITSVSGAWTLKRLKALPQRLIIDSGGYRYANNPSEALTPKQVLDRQLSLKAGVPISTTICALDYPILNSAETSNQKDASITQTIAFAYEFKNLIVQRNLENEVTPMAIVQGYNVDSLRYCAEELSAIGFEHYGVGSLAIKRDPSLIVRRVRAVSSVISAEKLHVFGVSGVTSMRALKRAGVGSIDSSRPAKAAMYNEILYSNPLEIYGILESADQKTLAGKIPRHRRLLTPLPCDCPICTINATDIMGVGKRHFIRQRALHNYYHLKRDFHSIGND